MKRDVVKRLAMNIWENADDFVRRTPVLSQPKHVTGVQYIRNGVRIIRNVCHSCGHEWDSVDNAVDSYAILARHYEYSCSCPQCGCNRGTLYSSGTLPERESPCSSQIPYYFFKKSADYSAVMVAVAKWDYKSFDADDAFAWLRGNAEMKMMPLSVFVLSGDQFVPVLESKVKTVNSTAVRKVFDNYSRFYYGKRSVSCFDTDTGKEDAESFDDLMKEMKMYVVKKERERKPNDVSENFAVSDLSQNQRDRIIEKMKPVVVKIMSKLGCHAEYSMACQRCGHTWRQKSVSGLYRNEIVCPNCNNSLELDGDSTYRTATRMFIVYDNTPKLNNALLVRFFNATVATYGDEGIIINGLHYRICETERLFISKIDSGKVKSKIFCQSDNTWKTGRVTDIPCGHYRSLPVCVQDCDEILSVINQSSMQYSGLAEAYGMNPNYSKICDPNDMRYLLKYRKFPQMELIVKANIPVIAKEYISAMHMDPMKGSTVSEVIGLKNSALRIARKYGLHITEISLLTRLMEADPSVDEETAVRLVRSENGYSFCSNYIQLNGTYGISVRKSMDYLQSVYDHQCIEKLDALGIWIDYLRMATACKFDLKDKSRKFPNSLKKEHDIAVFAYNKIRNEIDEQQFAAQAALNSYLEYSDKDYLVVVPKTPQDVVEEATAQKNCLRSYLSRIKEGATKVVFIRKKEEPDKSYVTVEVRDNHIVQVKGYCNSNPRNDKLNAFIRKWKTARAIA